MSRPRRPLLIAVVVVAAVAVAGGAVTAVLRRGEDPGPQRPMPVAERGPGANLVWGLRVPAGTVLLGRPVPTDERRERAYLRVTGDPAAAWSDLVGQLHRAGHLVFVPESSGSGCTAYVATGRGEPVPAEQVRPPPGTAPGWMRCRVQARPAAAARDFAGDLRSFEADLYIGGAGRYAANQLVVTVSAQNRELVLPTGPSDPWAEPGFSVAVPASAGTLPEPGETFATSERHGDEFRVVPGSHLVGLWTELWEVGDWPQCSGGAFLAVLVITGDVRKVRDGYVEQVPGGRDHRRDAEWTAGTDRVHRTELQRAIFLRPVTANFELRSVTDARNDTYAVAEYCRE
jgi:hypothetical protein